jgi:hypothetical protein
MGKTMPTPFIHNTHGARGRQTLVLPLPFYTHNFILLNWISLCLPTSAAAAADDDEEEEEEVLVADTAAVIVYSALGSIRSCV